MGDIESIGSGASKRPLIPVPRRNSLPIIISECIKTSVFDMYKIGPGPSSSHTIGPMKICYDFLQDLRNLWKPHSDKTYGIKIHLHGSLSATGLGHGTHTAVVGGLLGWQPATCVPADLLDIFSKKSDVFDLPLDSTAVRITADSIIWHDPIEALDLFHPNTLILEMVDSSTGAVDFSREYYSVGGGFIQKKGCPPEDARVEEPVYRYTTFKEIISHVSSSEDKSLDIVEFAVRNEMSLTGKTREEIFAGVGEIIRVMEAAVERGLNTTGLLVGPIGLHRKAKYVYDSAKTDPYNYLGFINAYSMAASEENAAGNMVVTAPTSGSAGVFPGLLVFMKKHLHMSEEQRIKGVICGSVIGFLIKQNSSISGAEMGCMGEIGTASSMGAAMIAYASGRNIYEIEAAAEIAMEHHLGLTCDPIGGYVQIPCIQRNPMGAVKAYNAYMLAIGSSYEFQKISFDEMIQVMRRTGQDMSSKYKETSQGGLALLTVNCPEC